MKVEVPKGYASGLPEIRMSTAFSDISKLIGETTSPRKPMTFLVTYRGKQYAVKKVLKRQNYGIDCLVVNACKAALDVEALTMETFRSNEDICADTCAAFATSRDSVFLMTGYVESSEMISNDVELLQHDYIFYEYVRCAVYRGIWRVSDFCERNVIFSYSRDKTYSIDENNIGERRQIIRAKDVNRFMEQQLTADMLDDIVAGFQTDLDRKIAKIRNVLDDYGQSHLSEYVLNNLMTLREDLESDLKL